MKNPSINMPDETLEKLDAIRNEMKRRGEIDMDTDRSPLVAEVLARWVEDQEERMDLEEDYWVSDEGNQQTVLAD